MSRSRRKPCILGCKNSLNRRPEITVYGDGHSSLAEKDKWTVRVVFGRKADFDDSITNLRNPEI
jgi:hypothetical protein